MSDNLDLLRQVVIRETKFLRHYLGRVLDDQDTLGRGRVKVEVAELGWIGEARGAWVWPRDKASMIPAKVGQWVEVYFMNGKAERGVYLGIAQEHIGNLPAAYGSPAEPVLFESPVTGDRVVYSESGESLSVVVGKLIALLAERLEFGSATEAMVLGDQLQAHLEALKTWADTHVHPGVTSGGASTAAPAAASPSPSGLLSDKMFGE